MAPLTHPAMIPVRFLPSLCLACALFLSSCGPEETSVSMDDSTATWETDSPAAMELTEVNNRLVQAYENEDVATLRAMLAEEHVHNNVFGTVLTRDVFLQDIESGTLKFISYETPEIRWHISGDTAIATGWIEASAERDGKPVPASRFLFTRVFVRESGEWKVLLFHNTMGKPPVAN